MEPNADGSRPARKRMPTINIDQFHVPDTSSGRGERTPDVDWTGHQYKSPADMLRRGRINYDHVGRTSTARTGK
jgi:hypothetical protein